MTTIAYIPIRSLFCTLVLWTAIGNTQPANSTLRHFPERVESALSRAGTNGAELVRFLEKTPESQKDAGQFLLANMPQPDLQSLSAAFLLENLSLAHEAMTQAPWSKNIPHDIFLNDVLPYASLTEQRDNWRKRLYEIAHPIVKGAQTPSEAAQALNQKMFTLLNVRYSTTRRAPDQGPFETMRSGVATCTGLSILLVDACRSVGVPARLAGTPLWMNNSGNHTWVEIWDNGWHFVGAAEPDPKGLDRGWFVGNAAQAVENDPKHAIYASSFKQTGLAFPLPWANAQYVQAVNVTARYTAKPEVTDTNVMRLRVNVLHHPLGPRIAAHLSITDSKNSAVHFEGVSKAEPADMNDHVSFALPKQRTYLIEARLGDEKTTRYYSPGTNSEDLLLIHLTGVPVVTAPVQPFCAPPPAVKPLSPKEEAKLKAAATKFFVSSPALDAEFSPALNTLLLKNEPAVRHAVWEAFVNAPIHDALKKSFDQNKVRSEDHVSPYTVKTVGSRPAKGWALFIAMHGGGGAPQELNDSQWRHMQIYYRDHPEVGGYRYVALRAPNNEWNGFYTGYVYPLIANLIQQFLLFADVDPDKVFLMGYSHGGYGAFAIGPKMPDRFAAVHASAAALADDASPLTLRNTLFTCMVGEKDTAYGRIDRDREFIQAIEKLRGTRHDIFPVTVSIIPGHPHSGLPDRDKIAEMYPAVRNPVPHELTWPMTDTVIHDFFWLHVPAPDKGRQLDATCLNNHLTITSTNLTSATIFLDSRLIDFQKPVTLELNGQISKLKLKPDLHTLCETMQRRGDPSLAFSARINLALPDHVSNQ